MGKSLLEAARKFARENRKKSGHPCGTCQLPEDVKDTVATLHAEGTHATVISAWLMSEKHPVLVGALKNHLNNHLRGEK